MACNRCTTQPFSSPRRWPRALPALVRIEKATPTARAPADPTRGVTDIGQSSQLIRRRSFHMILGSRLFAVTLDCPDPHVLARFYREIVGGDLRSSNDDFVVLSGTDGTVRLDFQR